MHEPDSRLRRIEQRLPELYLALALVLCGTMCFVTPPFSGPDEQAQSSRAVALSHGHLIAYAEHEEPGAQLDDNLIHVLDGTDNARRAWEATAGFFLDRHHGAISEQTQQKYQTIRWAGHTSFEPFGNTAVYPPGLYPPAILGWRVGEAAGWTIFASLRLARLLCMLTAVAMSWLALRLCVAGRWALLGFLLLPSVLFLDATSAQDPAMLGAASLAAALLSRALEQRRDFTNPELITTAALLGLIAMARPPYLALVLVVFLPAIELRLPWRRSLRPAAAFATVLAVCGLWWKLVSHLGIDSSDDADPTLQRIFLAHHPLTGIAAIVRGTYEAAGDFVRRGTYVIGWNDLLPHHGAALVLALCLLTLVLFAPRIELRDGRALGWLTLCVIAALLCISAAEYVIWTKAGWYTVWGIQPRYWLPILPFALILLQALASKLRRQPHAAFAAAALVVMAIIACTLPWMASHAFYGEPLAQVLRLNLR